MKKIISILLVATLLLGISAFATDVEPVEEIVFEEYEAPIEESMELYDGSEPASKVYFHVDFEDYETVADFLDARVTNLAPATGALPMLNFYDNNSTETKKANFVSNTIPASFTFVENGFGGKALKLSGTGNFAIIPDEHWNALEHSDEMYVLSYDIESNHTTTTGENFITYNTTSNYWYKTPEEGEEITIATGAQTLNSWQGIVEGVDVPKFNFQQNQHNNETGVINNRLTLGETYTNAQAFRADTATTNPQKIIMRNAALDGVSKFANTKIDDTEKYQQGMLDCDTHAGYYFTFENKYGLEISDIKLYSFKNQAGAFKVFMDETTGVSPTAESVTVKFSQPVAKKTLSANKFSMTADDGIAFSDFEIGRAKTYVDEVTGQIGTEVEIKFPHGLTSGTTYEVTVDSTIKNEIAVLSLGTGNNVASFTTAAAPVNTVSISGKAGLEGGDAITALEVGKQAKFTGKVETAAEAAYILLGVYDSSDNLVSYTFAKVNAGEEISLASKIEASGMKVKAFSAGNLYNLEPFSAKEDM